MILSKRLVYVIVGATVLLLLPLLAMQITTEVNWDFNDFIVGGILLYGTAVIFELIMQNIKRSNFRNWMLVILLLILLIIWVELAVGIF
jgi:hypothetical protein